MSIGLRSNQFETEGVQPPGELDETLFVGHAEESSAGGYHPYYRMAMGRLQLSLR